MEKKLHTLKRISYLNVEVVLILDSTKLRMLNISMELYTISNIIWVYLHLKMLVIDLQKGLNLLIQVQEKKKKMKINSKVLLVLKTVLLVLKSVLLVKIIDLWVKLKKLLMEDFVKLFVPLILNPVPLVLLILHLKLN